MLRQLQCLDETGHVWFDACVSLEHIMTFFAIYGLVVTRPQVHGVQWVRIG